jgi:hypothetical protein
MPQISSRNLIKDNPFFKGSEHSFEFCLKLYSNKNTQNSKYIVLAPVYKRIDLESIIFDPTEFFENRLIQQIKSKSVSLIFDCSGEGSHILFPYFKRFIDGLMANNIPTENFYYLTGDAAEKDQHQHTNVYHINMLDTVINRHTTVSNLDKIYYFTCLNRKPRYWRSKLIYELFNTRYKDKILVSHPKINNKNDFMNHDGFDVEDSLVNFFIHNSPIQVSNTQPLSDNMPFTDIISTLPEVYGQAVFDLTLETYQENKHEYITEKTFKPILNMMPVLIWGTPGINTTALKRLGFKLYEDWFDLSFDTEPDTEKRLNLLLTEVNRVCNELDNTDILQWQKKNATVLEHNRNLILNRLPTNILEFTRLYNDLEQA